MNMKRSNRVLLALLAFGMYFVTGAECMVVGSLLGELMALYGRPLKQVVLLGSLFAMGRVSTVYVVGKAQEKYGPLKIMFACMILMALYLGLVPLVRNYYAGLLLAFLGGVGMSGQDTACPVILSEIYPQRYASALSAGQGFYGLGAFALSLLVGLTNTFKIPFRYANVPLVLTIAVLLAVMPFTTITVSNKEQQQMVRPLYAKNSVFAYVLIAVTIFVYCFMCNTLTTYISSYIEFLGYGFGKYVLTAYSVGCVIGSVAFIFVLKKIREKTVLLFNSAAGLISLFMAVWLNRQPAWFFFIVLSGFFIGVLYSLILAIAARIGYRHIGLIGSLIGASGGLGDIITPAVTGLLVDKYSLLISMKTVLALAFIEVVLALIIYVITKEEKVYGYSE